MEVFWFDVGGSEPLEIALQFAWGERAWGAAWGRPVVKVTADRCGVFLSLALEPCAPVGSVLLGWIGTGLLAAAGSCKAGPRHHELLQARGKEHKLGLPALRAPCRAAGTTSHKLLQTSAARTLRRMHSAEQITAKRGVEFAGSRRGVGRGRGCRSKCCCQQEVFTSPAGMLKEGGADGQLWGMPTWHCLGLYPNALPLCCDKKDTWLSSPIAFLWRGMWVARGQGVGWVVVAGGPVCTWRWW